MMVVCLLLILNFSIGVLASTNYDRQEADTCITISGRLSVEAFERAAWESGTPVTNGKNWRVNKYDTTIDAVNGKETVYVRIENRSNIIHGHPISESEYNKLLKEH